MKKTYLWIIIIVFCLVSSLTYINTKYFFNPLTYETDKITNEPWYWYENPLYFSINNLSPTNSGKGYALVESKKEIEFLFNELKKSEPFSRDNKSEKKLVNISIHRKSDDLMLFYAHVYKDHIEFNDKSWKITKKLRTYINENIY